MNVSNRPQVVFVYAGQGAQFPGMARALISSAGPAQDAVAACDAIMFEELGWSVRDCLMEEERAERLEQIDVLQPLLLAIQVALTADLAERGVVPDAVLGHSIGEIAAAHAAGVLSLQDACRIMCRQGRLLRRASGQGAMALVGLSEQDLKPHLQDRGVSIAGLMAADTTVVSGSPSAVAGLVSRLQALGVFTRAVKADVAAHSHHMDFLEACLPQAVAEVRTHPAKLPIISTITGADASDGLLFGAAYWSRNLRETVRLAPVLEGVARPGTILVEIAPHPILLPSMQRITTVRGGLALATLRRGRDDRAALQDAVDRIAAGAQDHPAVGGGLDSTVRQHVAAVLRTSSEALDAHTPFGDLGLDSLDGLEVRERLETALHLDLPAVLLWTCPTLSALTDYLQRRLSATDDRAKQEPPRVATLEPIAVIGMGCRFPGGASHPDAYWDLMQRGDTVGQAMPWSDGGIPGVAWAARLDRDQVETFDCLFFGISPREAMYMDPQQRLLLEVAWEALEHANLAPHRLQGSRTAVYVGLWAQDYYRRITLMGSHDPYVLTGNMASIAAGRLSYVLGLQGPSMTLDAACASSLVSVHLACQALRGGESDLALAGGVHIILSAETMGDVGSTHALSPTGQCHTFDAAADGYVRGEGCGMVVLKRLSDAQRDGDTILGLIRSSCVNQDGRSTALTAPNVRSQQDLLEETLARGGVAAHDVTYVEAHGTGTPMGDPVEMAALHAVYGSRPAGAAPCFVGTAKTHIGHTETAAGVAGLIRVLLALQHEIIPGHPGFHSLNPHIQLEGSALRIPATSQPWPQAERPRVAAVSSFGMSGTNAHILVQEAPSLRPDQSPGPERPAHILVLSARDEAALQARRAQLPRDGALADVCYTAATGRTHFTHREAVVAYATRDLASARRIAGQATPQPPRVAFLFSGQGSQWPGMGTVLYDTQPVYRKAFERCTAVMDRLLPQPLLSVWNTPHIHDTRYTQPALFALEYALATLWRSWGIEPCALLGHSLGEYVAAVLAGVFTPENAAALVVQRGRLMQALPPGGGMAALRTTPDTVLPWLGENLSLAALNAPDSLVVSGEERALRALCERMAGEGVQCQRLNVSHAFHSPLMDPMLDEFRDLAATVDMSRPLVPLVSNLSGQFADAAVSHPDYWVRQVRETVRFADGVRSLSDRIDLAIEIGPRPVLLGLAGAQLTVPLLPSMRVGVDVWQTMLETLGELYVRGSDVDWQAFDAPYRRRKVSLPTYPFQRQRHWLEPMAGVLGQRHDSPGQVVFENTLDPTRFPWLQDHRVGAAVLFPAAAWLEMARAAAEAHFGDGPHGVEGFALRQPLVVAEHSAPRVQLVLNTETDAFELYSYDGTTWHQHGSGRLRRTPGPAPDVSLASVRLSVGPEVPAASLYAQFAAAGLSYGPTFQGLVRGWRGTGDAVAEIALPPGLSAGHGCHPALLDAAFQSLALTADIDLYVPFAAEQCVLHTPMPSRLCVHVARRDSRRGVLACDLTLWDSADRMVGWVTGLQCKRIGQGDVSVASRRRPSGVPEGWLYAEAWQPAPARRVTSEQGPWLILGDGAGVGPALQQRLAKALCREEWTDEEPWHGVVCLWGLADPVDPRADRENGIGRILTLLQRFSGRRMYIVTRGTLAQSPLRGLLRVATQERPELHARLIEVHGRLSDTDMATLLARELAADDSEDHICWRQGERFVARLQRTALPPAWVRASSIPQRLTVGQGGTLDQLSWVSESLRTPGPGEVEIDVHASSLNFRDVLNVLGQYPGVAPRLGADCAGVVTAVGAEVSHVVPGDRVMAMGEGCMATRITIDARTVVRLPDNLTLLDAATLPVAFVTAWYALHTLAGIKAGQRVLIHCAAGGVGMAAVQVARAAGADVFATASPSRWDRLRRLGVSAVSTSRSLAFVDAVHEWTGGRGVDIVLNALSGDFIPASLGLVATGGCFLEMGKLDVWSPQRVAATCPQIRYHAFDLAHLAPARVGNLLTDLASRFASGELRPLPRLLFPAEEATEAFRTMAQARHVGKILLTYREIVEPQATYLISGGLGALGRLAAERLIALGAGCLVLIAHRPPDAAAQAWVAGLPATVRIEIADVARPEEVRRVLAAAPGPLRGIVHAAGVLEDAALHRQTWDSFYRVLLPKMDGAWNLHLETQDMPLDFFVLYSSVASLLGPPGQANYASANSFVDALAAERNAQGLPALAINWGPWETGMAASHKRRLQAQGLQLIPAGAGADALEALLQRRGQVAVLPIEWPTWPRRFPYLEGLLQTPAPRALGTSSRLRVLEEVRRIVARALGLAEAGQVTDDRPLRELGADSLMAIDLRNALSKAFDQPLPATLVYDHPTVARLAEYLGAPAKAAEVPSQEAAPRPSDAIAIIGMGCRFPGGVDSPEAFWRMLVEGRDAVTEVPPERWDVDRLYDPDPDAEGRMVTRWGGFVANVDQFDAAFFGVAPREAASLDPQQRLLLEVSWEALEHAAVPPASLAGSPTGVFVGLSTHDYATMLHDAGHMDAWTLTGSTSSVAAGRLSYLLGLQGPSMAVDTACSSALLAVHLAARSLRDGECDLALAGGVNLILTPETTVYFSRLHAMSPTGRCKAFDATADGYVRSEGCGMVVLKRLADAQAAGDPILAVLRGSAVNQDGRSNGLTAPNGPAQQAVVRRALAVAGIPPERLAYVEAHGTGTPLGDPIEMQALGAVVGPQARLLVGSVKSNIGHTEAAAGIAGLIKAVLCLTHEAIPPHLHFCTPNPHIPWDRLAVRVPTGVTPFKTNGTPRVVGVSSFGFSGTNVHAILEEAPPAPVQPSEGPRPLHLLPVSAPLPEALRDLAARYASHLDSAASALAEVCATSALGRNHFESRLAVVAATREEAARQLLAYARHEAPPGVHAGSGGRPPHLVFLFPGRGDAYRMGRAMSVEPVFCTALEECDARLPYSLVDALYRDGDPVDDRTLFAVEYALGAVWRSWGVEPVAALGEGVGEWVAACIMGTMSLEDALHRAAIEDTGADVVERMRELAQQGVDGFLEVGPEPALTSRGQDALRGGPALWLCSMRGGGDPWRTMLDSLAEFYVRGGNVRWEAVVGRVPRSRATLPGYCFQRRRFWIQSLPEPALLPETAPEHPPICPANPDDVLGTLQAALPQERFGLLLAVVREQVARALRMEAAELPSDTSFQKLGVDSLMALDLLDGLSDALHVELPTTLTFDYPSIAHLTGHLLESLPL